MRYFNSTVGIVAIAVLLPSVAFAFRPLPVPEPETLPLVATALAGSFGAYAISKWFRRK